MRNLELDCPTTGRGDLLAWMHLVRSATKQFRYSYDEFRIDGRPKIEPNFLGKKPLHNPILLLSAAFAARWFDRALLRAVRDL